jgi:queuine tRNA-ribosyltransferase
VRSLIVAVFTIRARAPDSQARSGTLHLAHGEVRTPAFVPLATRGVVKTLEPRDLEALGFEMVLGNTFHLFLTPGPDLIARQGGLNRFMRWSRPIITDSGGYQVFSMQYGGVADEIKGRRRDAQRSEGTIRSIEEQGVRFRSYLDGSEKVISPEVSMSVQASLGSDIALAFDECTPFHVSRDYTARSMERTHRWLERCLTWHGEHGPDGQMVYGIVQGGVEHDLRLESTAAVATAACDGVAIGGSLGQEEAQMHEVVGWTTAELDRRAPDRPRHLLGIGDIPGLIRGVELGVDTFDCAIPTRLGRHGVALVPEPENRWRLDLVKGRWRDASEPILAGCACPACSGGFTRAYLHYLLRGREMTGLRLITLHNLHFLARLMEDLRKGIDEDRLPEVAQALRAGATPGSLTSCTDSPGSTTR